MFFILSHGEQPRAFIADEEVEPVAPHAKQFGSTIVRIRLKKEHGHAVKYPTPKLATPSPVSPDPGGGGLLELLKRRAEASLVFAALLYVTGWSYLDVHNIRS